MTRHAFPGAGRADMTRHAFPGAGRYPSRCADGVRSRLRVGPSFVDAPLS